MNNEQLQAAKDQAAREIRNCDFAEAIITMSTPRTNREGIEALFNRAMEIYAEWVMDKTVEDQKFLLEATYTEGIRKGFDAARLGGGFWDVVFDYDTVEDYLNSKK